MLDYFWRHKMSLISSVAFLDMCECGRHGQFVLVDGTKSPEFCSKEKAREELKKLHDDKTITDLEFKFLKDQISDSPRLASTDERANILTQLACEIANSIPYCEEQSEKKKEYVM